MFSLEEPRDEIATLQTKHHAVVLLKTFKLLHGVSDDKKQPATAHYMIMNELVENEHLQACLEQSS